MVQGHEATGVTRVDFLNLHAGASLTVHCLGGPSHGSAFLLLRFLG